MGLTFIAIVLLVVAWGALLLPDLRTRRRGSRRGSIDSFSRQLSTLQRTRRSSSEMGRVVRFPQPSGASVRAGPRDPLAPRSPRQARQRRQVVLVALAGLALVTLWATVTVATALVVVHLAVDALLASYLWLLRERRVRAVERGAKLRQLHHSRPSRVGDGGDGEAELGRTASGG